LPVNTIKLSCDTCDPSLKWASKTKNQKGRKRPSTNF
jgi:hypothetical protein